MDSKNQTTRSQTKSTETIGDRIRKLKESNGETNQTLADLLGYANGSNISKIFEKDDISISDLRKLAKHYGVTYDYLIDGSDCSLLLASLLEHTDLELYSFQNPDIDSQPHMLPIIKIENNFYKLLFEIARANFITILPKDLQAQWISSLKKNYAKSSCSTDNQPPEYCKFIALDKKILEKDDCDSHRFLLKLIDECQITFSQD